MKPPAAAWVLLFALLAFSSTVQAGTWSFTAWTGDSSTNIGTNTLWAQHFGSTATATVNGVSVTGTGTTASTTPVSNAQLDITMPSVNGIYNNDSNQLTALGGNGSALIGQNFIYNGSPATVTLKGLTAGQSYTVSFLSAGWDSIGRVQTFTSGSDSLVVDQDNYGQHYGIRIDYAFTPSAATQTITVTPQTANTFHFYAISLEVGPPTVTAVLSPNGSTAGGTAVTIVGTGFTGATGVTIGGVAATSVTVVNDTMIDCTTGAHAAGAVNVAVTTPGGTGTGTGLYTYGAASVAAGSSWTQRTAAGTRSWQFIASSADGRKLVGASNGSQLYTSTDSGATWTARDSIRGWWSVASSADGSKLVAVESNGQIYTSTDSGANWTARDSSRSWWAVTSSADGTHLAAVVSGGQIYTSSDSGVTWTPRESARFWRAITSSTDGSKLVAAAANDQIFTSTDYGVTWTARDSSRSWLGVASSADGTKLVACANSSALLISTDSGATWSATSSSSLSWKGCASSADGTRLAACAYGDQIYTSTNSGSSWTAVASTQNWRAIASSADGSALAAGADPASIWTSQGSVPPTVTAISPTSGSTAGGTSVTITGTGFTGATGVTIGGTAATSVSVVNDTSITCTTPAGTAGTASVLVTTPGGTNAANSLFTYVVSAPVVVTLAATSITATSAVLHGTVNALGNSTDVSFDLGLILGGNLVYVANTAGTPTPVTGSTAVAVTDVLPSLSPGVTYHFRVNGTNTAGTTNGNDLTFTTLSTNADLSGLSTTAGAISPSFDSTVTSYASTVPNATTSVTVTPTVAQANATVTVNGVTVTSGSASGSIALNVGSNAITILVTAQDGSTTKTTTLTVTRASAAPTVTAISPTSGSTAGGTSVTITGTGFTGATGVTIGGTAATNLNVVSGTQITATTAAHAAGASSVLVTTPNGTNAANSLYTFANTAPTLAAISKSGFEDTTVTFTAADFTSAYTDAESDALSSITVATLPATGALKLSGTNVTVSQVITAANLPNLTYVPAANDNGAKTFTVTASDGSLSSTAATVTMTLTAVNDAPSYALAAGVTSPAGVTWTARDSSQTWQAVASSSDGTKLAAVVNGGLIYTSTDSGATWTAQASSGSRGWNSIASSSDGTKLAAVVGGGGIYTSTDSGVTWTLQSGAGSRNWAGIASSADGTKLVTGGYFINIYTSTDSGVTWTARDSARQWAYPTSSADGTKLAMVEGGGGLVWTSSDSGATWTSHSGTGGNLSPIAGSADGTKLVTAAAQNGTIYTSSNSGSTWTSRASQLAWNALACSADGTKMFAAVQNGQIYTSTDSGVTWTAQSGSGNRNWNGLACSSDGSKLVGVVGSGQIYTSAASTAPYAVTVNASAGAQSIANVATSISAGPADESSQTVNFVVTNTNNALFTAQPAIDASGTLTFTPVSNTSGVATVSVQAHDNGGTANGGVDTSVAQTFTLTVLNTPTVTTPTSASLATTSATLGGNITANGGATVTGSGVVFAKTATNANPQIGGTGVTNVTSATTSGVFTISATSLTPNTGYSYAAYATNSVGTSYTTVGTFTTTCPIITVTKPSTTTGFTGVAFSQTFTQSGAGGTPTFATSSTLPTGLTLSSAGVLSGTPSQVGTFPITVTVTDSNSCTGTSATYTLVIGFLPAVASISPTSGSTAGGTNVTITGTGFTGATGVTIGGTAATNLNVVSDTQITATTAAHAAGASSVLVTNTYGTNAANSLYTFANTAPTLAAISKSSFEDTTVTFTAADFTSAYTDAESNALSSITVATLPATGALKLSGTNVTVSQVITAANLGNLTYVPAVNENGAKTFTVTASDGSLSSTPATTVTMTLAAVNDAPTLDGPAGGTWAARDSSRSWIAAAASSDGTKLVACSRFSGQLYTSTNSGTTWTARDSNRDWIYVASSSDGTKLVAVDQNYPSGGSLYTSTDSGVTWTARAAAGSRLWSMVASSDDGTKLVAAPQNGQLLTSTDSGVTWTARESSRLWFAVASSSDGTKLAAAVQNGGLYTSTDSGVNWTLRSGAGSRDFKSIASSADGTKLVAAANGAQLLTSTDSGVNWTSRESSRGWRGVASSSDGAILLACATGGQLYVSSDSGVTWAARESSRSWNGVGMSANGAVMVGAPSSANIYVSTASLVPLTIAEDATAQTVNLTGITSGAANESQTLTVTATSGNTALIPNPTVTYTSANTTGSLSFTPVANANGVATITVTVTDDATAGGAALATSQTFTVTVTPVNDAPTDIALSATTIAENNAANATVGTLSTTDVDTGDTFTYTLVSGTGSTDNASFTISGSSLKLTPSADYETKNSYAVRIRTTDSGSLFFEKAFTISITNVIETPVIASATTANLASTTVTLGGNVTSDGGAPVTERGVVYALTATNSNPQIGGTGVTKVAGTGTTGVFTVDVSGLSASTGYSYAAYVINADATSYTSAGTFTTTAAFAAGTGVTVTYSAVIGGGNTVSITGGGTLALTAPNTYTAPTNVQAGTVSINTVATGTTPQSLGAGNTVNLGVASTSSGSLVYTGGTATLDKTINALGNGSDKVQNSGSGLLTLSGTLNKTGTTLTLQGGANGITVSGSITGNTGTPNSDLIVDGGTVTLASANTYNGPTYIINGGTLNANATDALPTSVARTAIIMDQSGTGSSTLSLGVSQSALSLTGAASSAINLNANTLTMGTTSGSATFAGIISGTGGLTQDGASTQVLTGANTFTGNVTVSAGTLEIGGTGSILQSGNASTVTVASGATALLSGATYNVLGFQGTEKWVVGGTINSTGGGAQSLPGGGVTLNGGTLTSTATDATYGAFFANAGQGAITANGTGNIISGVDVGIYTNANLTFNTPLAGDTLTASAVLRDAGGAGVTGGTLIKTGSGTAILSAANTYTGATTISAGTLQIGAGSTTGSLSTSSSITDNGTLAFNRSNTITQGTDFASVISGSGGVTQSGSGTLVLNGANTYTGATTVSAGVVNIQNGSALGTNAAGTSVASGAALQIQGSITTAAEALSLNGTGVSNDGALRNISGTNTYAGLVTLASATRINSDTGSLTLSNTGAITGSGLALTVGGAGNTTINSIIGTGTGTLTKDGAGTVILSGANTYTGVTTVSGGTLQAGSASAFTNKGDLQISGSGVLDLGGNAVGFVNASSSSTTSTLTNNGAASARLNFSNLNTQINSLIQDGSKSLAVSYKNDNTSNNLFKLDSPNTFSGGVTILDGVGVGSGIGSRLRISNLITTVGAAGSIVSSPFGTGAITIGQAATDKAGVLFDVTANNALANAIVFNTALGNDVPGLRVDTAATGLVLSGRITANLSNALFSNGTSVNGLATVNLTGQVTGAAGLQTNASAIAVNLNNAAGNNDYAGNTIIGTGSSILLGRANQVPNGAGKGDVAISGTFNLNGFSETINGLSGAGTVEGASGTPTLTVGDNNATGNTFSGVIKNTAGTLALTKIGTGTQILSGTNTYTGATTITAGTLQVDGSIASGSTVGIGTAGTLSGAGTINGNATLTGSGIINLTNPGVISGTLGVTGGNWNGAGSVTGLVTSSSGTFTIGSGANLTANGNLSITGGTIASGSTSSTITGSVNYTSASSSTFGGVIAGSGKTVALNNSAATLTLTGANTYTGTTTVSAGILNIQNATGLGTTAGGTSVSNGATLQLQGGITVGAEALSLNGGSASGQTGALVNVSGTNTYGGAITVASSSSISAASGSVLNLTGGVVKNGTVATFNGGGTINVNTVAISGSSANSDLVIDGTTVNLGVANTYNGPTFIRNGGTLNANVANALPTANGRTDVTFDGTGTSVLTLGADQSVASLTSAGAATVTLNANTLTVGAASGSTTFAGAIGGTGGLIKDGASTQIFTGASSYTGTTVINAGTLVLNKNTNYASSTTTVNASGTLELTSTDTSVDNWRINSVLTGSGTINKTGAGWVMTFTNPFTASGTFNVQQGTFGTSFLNSDWTGVTADFNISSGALLDARGQAITVGSLNGAGNVGTTWNSAATVNVGAANKSGSFSGVISGNASSGTNITSNPNGGVLSLTKIGTGTQILSGANTYTGTTTISAGTLQIGAGGTTGSLSTTSSITDNGTLSFNRSNTITQGTDFKNVISGSGAVIQAGSGTLVLNGANTYTSTTTVSAGVVNIQNANALGTTAAGTSVASGAALQIQGGITTVAEALTLNGTGVSSDGALRNISGSNSYAGLVTLGSDTRINSDAGTLTLSNTGTITGSGFGLTVGGASNTTINSIIGTGTGSLTKDGAGTLTLGANNSTFSGNVTINTGTVVASGGLNNTTNPTFGALGNPQASRTITINTGATLSFATHDVFGRGASTPVAALSVVGGTITNDGTHFNVLGPLTLNGGTLNTNGGSGSTFQSYRFSGTVTVTGGTTSTISGSGAFSGYHLSAPTTFDVAASTTLLTSGILIDQTGDQSSAAGGLTKAGTGTMVLSGANTYTGATTISAGTLQIGNGSTTGSLSTSSSITDNATLAFNRSNTITQGTDFNSVISGTGAVTQAGSGTLVLSGTNTYTGATTINSGGTLQIGAGGTTGSLSTSSSITDNGTLTFNRSNTITQGTDFNSVISGTGGVTQAGSGTLVLNGANTYTGATTITAGVINIQNASALGTNAAGTSVTAGAALQIQGGITTVAEALTLNGTGVSNDGALRNISGNNSYAGLVTLGSATRINSDAGTLTLSNSGTITGSGFGLTVGGAGNATINSIIGTGSGTLTKDGTGTLTLTGTNTYTGATTVSAGVVNIQNASALGTNATGTSVTAGAALQIQGGITTVAEALTLNGTGVSNDGALRNISGTNSYAGLVALGSATRINSDAGTLTLSNSGTITGSGFGLTVGGAGNTTINSIIGTGSGTLTKDGAGVVVLNGANTFTGNITVNGGTLTAGGNSLTNALGSPTVAGRTITVNNSGSTLSFATNNVFGGGVGNSNLPSITLNAGTTLTSTNYNVLGDISLNGATLTQGSFDSNGYEGFQFRGNVTIGGSAASTITTTNTKGDHLAANTVFNVANVTGDALTDLTVSVRLIDQSADFSSAAGGLTKSGLGTMLLTAANTYTGATIITGGTLKLQSGGGASVSGFGSNGTGWTINGGASISSNVLTLTDGGGGEARSAFFNTKVSTAAFTCSFNYLGSGSADGATFALHNDSRGASAVGSAGGSLGYGGGGAISPSAAFEFNLYAGAGNIGVRYATNGTTGGYGSTGSVSINSGNQIQVTLVYDGTNTLTVTLKDTVTTATYSTSYTVGSLATAAGGATAYLGFTGGTGGATSLQQISNFSFTNGATSVLASVTSVIMASGTTFDLGNGVQQIASLADQTPGSTTGHQVVLGSGGLTVGDTTSTTFSGIISGTSGSLTKLGTGTLSLSGANTFTGATTITAGTLQIGAGGTTGSLSTSSSITDNGTLTFNRSNTTTQGTDFASVISGSGGVTQAGSGTLVLNGANTYTGATTITAGVINIQNANALGTTAAGTSVASGAALQIQGGITTVAEALTLNGTGVSNDGALRNISGTNSYAGLVTLGSTTRINSDSGTLTLSNSGTITGSGFGLTVGGAGNTTINSIIGTGSGTLTMDGSGTATLTNSNTYTGSTTVSAGTLSISGDINASTTLSISGGTLSTTGANKLANTAAVTVSGGTLTVGGADTVSTLSMSSGTIGGSSTLTATTYGLSGGTVNGNLGTGTINSSGTVALNGTAGASTVNVTAGTLTLGASSALNSATTVAISVGSLVLGASGQIGSSAAVSVSGGTLALGSFSDTVSSVVLSSGSITGTTGVLTSSSAYDVRAGSVSAILGGSVGLNKTTAGTVTLSGSNTYTGTTAITGGTLKLQSGAATPSGVVAYYQFNNSGSLGVDSSTQANNLVTGTGSPAYTSSGKYGGALYLNGSSTLQLSGGAFPSGVPTGSNPYTVAAWIKADTGCSLSGGWIGYGNNSTNQGNNFRLNGANNSVWEYWYFNDMGATMPSGTFFDGWHYVVGTWDGTTEIIYIDGVQIASRTPSGLNVGTGTFVVGKTTADANWTGWIDDLMIANRAFSPAEVVAQMNEAGGANVLATTPPVQISSGATLDLNGVTQTIYSLADNGGAGGSVTNSASSPLTLTVNPTSGSTSFSGIIIDSGSANAISFVKTGAGTQIFSGANSYTGTTTVSAGTLQIGAGSTTGSLSTSSSITDNATLTFNRSNTITQGTDFASVISGSGTVTQAGSGTLVLAGTNTYTGATTVSSGVLNIQNANALGTTAAGTSVTAGAALQIQGSITTAAEALTLNGLGVSNDGALRNISGTNSYAGLVTLGSATRINSDSGTLTLSNTGTITGATFGLTVGGAGNTTINSIIGTTSGTLTQDGTGTLTLAGANTYTGATTVSSGILNIQNATGLGTTAGGTSVSNGATLQLQGGITVGAEALSLNGGAASGQTGALVNVNGTNTYGGAITVTASSSISAASGSVLNLTGGVVKNGTVATFNGGGTINVNTVAISGSSANSDLVIDGATVNLGVANTYNGPTFIRNGGTLNANVTNALPTANGRTDVTFDGTGISVLSLGADQSVASLTAAGAATVTLNSSALTVGAASGSTTFAGAIGGTGGLIKDGASTLVLSGTNGYTGATLLSAGNLIINGSIGSSSLTTINGGTLLGTGTVGAIQLNSGGVLNPGGTATAGALSTGNLAIVAGQLVFNLGGTSSYSKLNTTGSINLAAGGTGAQLVLNAISGYAATLGDSFTLVSNNLTNTISGAFAKGTFGGTKVVTLTGVDYVQGLLGSNYYGRITYNSGTGNDLVLKVVTPVMTITQSGAGVAAGGTYSFGSVDKLVPAVPLTKTFTIQNTGGVDLMGIVVHSPTGAAASDYTIDLTGTASTLPPGSSTTFTVTFNPSRIGTRAAAIAIDSNDLTNNPFNIILTGVGSIARNVTDGWTVAYAGPDAPGTLRSGMTKAVAVQKSATSDTAVAVFATGYTSSASGGQDIYTAKYDPVTGALLWAKTFNGAANLNDEGAAIAVDSSGNVVITGYTTKTSTDTDVYVAKYAGADGTLLWQKIYAGAGNNIDIGASVAVDSTGNVAVAGYGVNASAGMDIFAARYSADGATTYFEKLIDGGNQHTDEATAVAMNSTGNLVVAGFASNAANNKDFMVMQLDATTGTTQWKYTFNGSVSADDLAYSVAVNAANEVVATGYVRSTTYDLYTVKLSSNGSLVWQKQWNGPYNSSDAGYKVVIDSNSDVILGGTSYRSASLTAGYVAKYSGADGSLVWERRFDGSASLQDLVNSVDVDASNNVVATGYLQNAAGNYDVQTSKMLAADGSLVWQKLYNDAASKDDIGVAVAISPDGNVYVGGYSTEASGTTDFLVKNYQTSTASVQTSQTITFANPGTQNAGAPLTLSASADSGLTVYFSVISGPAQIDSNSNTLLNFTGSGSVTVRASQSGSSTYAAATPVDQTFTVNKSAQTISFTLPATLTSTVQWPLTGVASSGLAVTYSVTSGPATISSGVLSFSGGGSVTITASQAGDARYNAATDVSATVTVNNHTPVVIFNNITENWRDIYAGTGAGQGADIALQLSGNEAVAGFVGGFTTTSTGKDLYLAKYLENGTLVWSVTSGTTGDDEAMAVDVDGNGDVYVTGYVTTSTGQDVYVAKYSGSAGTKLWSYTYNGTGNSSDVGVSLDFDGTTNVVVGAYVLSSGTSDDFFAAKLNQSTGAVVWTSVQNRSGTTADLPAKVVVGTDGSVVLGGISSNDAWTIKLAAADGTRVWQQVYNFANKPDGIRGLALDAANNVFIAAYSQSANYDMYTAKYAALDGSLIWGVRYNSSYNSSDAPWDMVLDQNANVYVSGTSYRSSSLRDAMTLKYSGVDGSLQWQSRFNANSSGSDENLSVSIDGIGNPVSAGYTTKSDGTTDVTLLKCNKASGSNTWQTTFDGGSNKNDSPKKVKVDPNGNVWTTGVTTGASGQLELFIVRHMPTL